MVSDAERAYARKKAAEYYNKAGIFLKDEELVNLEVADFGLGRFNEIGITIHIYLNTHRVSAKEMVLLPYQICPEQRHPPYEGCPEGKEESFRVRWGTLYVYTEGVPVADEQLFARIPEDKKDTFSVFHQIKLEKGDQFTMPSNMTHWIVGGPEGCVISEFATPNTDEIDYYADPAIRRMDF